MYDLFLDFNFVNLLNLIYIQPNTQSFSQEIMDESVPSHYMVPKLHASIKDIKCNSMQAVYGNLFRRHFLM